MTTPLTKTLPESASTAPRARTGLRWARIALGLLLLAGLVYVGRTAGESVPRFAQWVDGMGALGPIVFIVGYATAVVAFVPGSLLTLAAGAIFGLAEGTFYVFLAASAGATAAFLIARYAARAAIERRIEGDPRFAAIDRAIGQEGRKIAFLLRLSPVFPFSLLNYALGLTKIRVGDYVVACLGMLPGTLLYVYTGKLVGDVAAVAGGAAPERGAGYWALLVIGLLATASVTFFVTRLARRALAHQTGEPSGESLSGDPE